VTHDNRFKAVAARQREHPIALSHTALLRFPYTSLNINIL
jgi:hypothetical protein